MISKKETPPSCVRCATTAACSTRVCGLVEPPGDKGLREIYISMEGKESTS